MMRTEAQWVQLLLGKCGHHKPESWARELMQINVRISAEIAKKGQRFSLVVDTHENHMWPFFEGFPWVSRQELACFDVLWLDSAECIVAGIERKTLADLRSSIHSGHYRNQRARMLQSTVATKAFLCEGVATTAAERMEELNCQANCTVRDGLSWWHTLHLADTVAFLMRKTLAYLQHGQQSENGVRIPEAFENFHNPETGLTNPHLSYLAMLSCVPGLSGPMAAAIETSYPNMAVLAAAFASKPDSVVQKIGETSFVSTAQRVKKHESGSGKPRKIGPAVATRLRRFLQGIPDSPKKPKVQKPAKKDPPKLDDPKTHTPTWQDFKM